MRAAELDYPPRVSPHRKQEHARDLMVLRVLMVCAFVFAPLITVSPGYVENGCSLG